MSLKDSAIKAIQKRILGYEADVLTFSQAGETFLCKIMGV